MTNPTSNYTPDFPVPSIDDLAHFILRRRPQWVIVGSRLAKAAQLLATRGLVSLEPGNNGVDDVFKLERVGG